jgi:superoxide dismutase, Fe-Mn family
LASRDSPRSARLERAIALLEDFVTAEGLQRPGSTHEETVMRVSRREVISGLMVGAVALSKAGGRTMANPTDGSTDGGVGSSGLAPGKHPIAPLPFDPSKLKGLSEKLLRSHHENNYGGAVKNLNKVEEELTRVTKETPAFLVGGLKERELVFNNSMVLHELYFGNLGGEGKPGSAIQSAIARAFGGFGRWEELFRLTGMSLAGGSGWVFLDYNFQTRELRTHWSGNHSQSAASSQPLLVMDMYEHAYQMDYGAAAAKYIDAFFQNVQWDEVQRRLERAERAAAALRS